MKEQWLEMAYYFRLPVRHYSFFAVTEFSGDCLKLLWNKCKLHLKERWSEQ